MAQLKNTTVNDTTFLKLPVVTATTRPSSDLSTASFNYNSSLKNTELYRSTNNWVQTSQSPRLRDGLVLDLDADFYAEKNLRTPLLGAWTWRVGGTDATNFGRNGQAAENSIFMGTDPFGNSSLIWGSFPNGSGNDDGGWNSSFYSSDPRKTYRSTVWVRRTSSTTGGTFYHGTNGGNQDVLRLSDGGVEGNPYWHCSNISSLVQNQWYLYVSHFLPHYYTKGSRHPNTGVYTIENGRTGYSDGCNVGVDVRMNVSTTSIRQRVYHYYCNDSTSRLQWWQPRLEEITGTEPSIEDILSNKINHWSSPNAVLQNFPQYISLERALVFEPTGCKHVKLEPSLGYASSLTVAAWIKTKGAGDGGYHIICGPSDLEVSIPNGSGAARVGVVTSSGRFVSDHGSGLNNGNWHHVAMTFNGSTKTAFIDGVSVGTQAVTGTLNTRIASRSIGTFGSGDTTYGLNGYLSQYQLYSKSLSTDEIKLLFDSQRARYGI